ncbi:MAG: M15 family metallopeptidase [Alphaproteobacteria bacterium]|nr:M15 family metallopeptidase [Alphaproteobacteria bacterium]
MKKLMMMINVFVASTTPLCSMEDDASNLESKGITTQPAGHHSHAILHPGFVYLDEIDSTIRQSLRYFSNDNFTGRPMVGYNSSRIILTKETANALAKAQALFKKDGYSIVVYDAYRPQTTVDSLGEWSKDPNDQKMKAWFYPRVDKEKVFELGYVAEKSGHSRGSTVDLSLILLETPLRKINPLPRQLQDGYEILLLDDGTMDMGSSFDLFDKASHYKNNLISEVHQKHRTYLKEIMESCGFAPYAEEWWHFTLKDEPFPDTYFDFPIK